MNECYSRENEIFFICYRNLFLPEEYKNHYELTLKLGLRTKIQDGEILETALKLRKMFYANAIKIEDLEKYVHLIFNEIKTSISEDKAKSLIEKIKEIKFIPNYYIHKQPFNCHIYNPNFFENRLICLKDSYFKINQDFVWITHNILPDFCEKALKCSKETNLFRSQIAN